METLETEDIVHVLLHKAFHSLRYRAKLAPKIKADHFTKSRSPKVMATSMLWVLHGLLGTHGLLVALLAIDCIAGPVC